MWKNCELRILCLVCRHFGRHQPWFFIMSNLPVVHCLALGARKPEVRLWSSSSTELSSLLLSTEEVSLLLSIENNGSISSTESGLSLIFCNRRRMEPPRTLPRLLLLLLPILVIGGTWMVWAETMMECIDEDTTKLAARRNNFTVLDEIMVMAFLFVLDVGCFELCCCVWLVWIKFVTMLSLFLLCSQSSPHPPRLLSCQKKLLWNDVAKENFDSQIQLKTTTCTTCLV